MQIFLVMSNKFKYLGPAFSALYDLAPYPKRQNHWYPPGRT